MPAPDLHRRAGSRTSAATSALRAPTGDRGERDTRGYGDRAAFPPPMGGDEGSCAPRRTAPAEGNVAVGAERTARVREVRVGEEVPEPCLRQKLFDPGAIGAFRQPAARRERRRQSAVLALAHGQLVAGCFRPARAAGDTRAWPRSDDLQQAALLEASKGGDQVPSIVRNSACRRLKRDLQNSSERPDGRRRFIAGSQTLGEKRFPSLGTKTGLTSWFAKDGRESDCQRRRRCLGEKRLELLQQREVGVERGLAQPVAAVRPASVFRTYGR